VERSYQLKSFATEGLAMRPRGCLVGLWRGLFAAVLAAVCLTQAASANDTIAREPAAAWVETLELPAANPAFADRVKDGISYLLSEFQFRPIDGGRELYDRLAYQVVDRTGLDNGARISFEFNPGTESVILNRLQIIRNGVTTDRLQTAKIEIARRETDADSGIFDGRLTAYINVPDVRVGDIIDRARTTVRKPVIGGALEHMNYTVEWSVPVARHRIKAIWPTGRPLFYQSRETEIEPTVEINGDSTVYIWDSIDSPPVKPQPDAPPGYPDQGYVEISSTNKWQDVVDAARPHYRLDQELPAEFAARLDQIAAQFPKPEDRLVEALRLVQDDIRYVSLAIGNGSHIPRSPTEVVTSGFGDCKDKSLLLAISLRRLGVDADVALTDTDEGPALPDRLPGITLFDHMIVKAKIGTDVYWLDPTDYLQGGRADGLVPPKFGYALPFDEANARLEAIRAKPLILPTASVLETFDFPKSEGAPLTLGVVTTYRGSGADSMRYRLKRESTAKFAEDYLKYYDGLYPGIESTASLQFIDDRDANIVTVMEKYTLSSENLVADDLIKSFPLQPDIGVGDLPEPSKIGRTAPVWLGRLVYKQHKVVVTNLKARFAPPPDAALKLSPFATMTTWTSATDTQFEAMWTFLTVSDRVPASYIGAYLKAVDDFSSNTRWTYDFTYTGPKTE